MREELRGYPFAFGEDSVSILGGADEGAFQWLTLNYLLGNLGGRIQVCMCGVWMRSQRCMIHSMVRLTSAPFAQDTVAAIDLGGGSVQLAHAVDDVAADKAPMGYVLSGLAISPGTLF